MLSESINLTFSNTSGGYKNITKPINFKEVDAIGVRLNFNSDFSVDETDGYSSIDIQLGPLYIFSANLNYGIAIEQGTSVFVLFTFFPGKHSNYGQEMAAIPHGSYSTGSTSRELYYTSMNKFSLDTSDIFFAGIVKDISGPKCSGNITADIYKVYF